MSETLFRISIKHSINFKKIILNFVKITQVCAHTQDWGPPAQDACMDATCVKEFWPNQPETHPNGFGLYGREALLHLSTNPLG